MRKAVSFALSLVFLFSFLAAAVAAPAKLTAQQADMQISYMFSNLKSFQQDETNSTVRYALTDLDHNGCLEIIAASLNQADHSTTVKIWELNVAESSFKECEVVVPQGDSFPDIIVDNADTFYNSEADTWSYLFIDNVILSPDDTYAVKTSIQLKDGKLGFTRYAVQHSQVVNGYQTTTFSDMNGAAITPEAFNAAGVNAHPGTERSNTSFDWFSFRDASTMSRLADSYAVFAGEKQPDKSVPAPIPTVAPQPYVRPSYLMVTKNPTNESHYPGETAWFISDANTYESLSWTFVSPDGGEYSWSNFNNVFPDADVGGVSSTTLSIGNVSEDMDGWGAYCTFYYGGQTARTSTAYLYVQSAPGPTPPDPPYPGGSMSGTVSDYGWSTVSIDLENGSSVTVSMDICTIGGELSVGAPCDVSYNVTSSGDLDVYSVIIYGDEPQPGPIYGSISGVVHDITASAYRIDLSNGDTVYEDSGICNLVSGNLAEGCSCTAYYMNYPSEDNIYSVDIYGVYLGLLTDDADDSGNDVEDDNDPDWVSGVSLGAENG